MATEVTMIQQAFKFALDPTPRQAQMLASHAGARRAAFNFAHAMISAAADARKAQKEAGEEVTIPLPRQMKTSGHRGIGVEWTEFKNTAVGCKTCRRLLARDPASPAAPWADARTGSITCEPDALKRAGSDGAPGPHDPTTVGCDKCWEPLRETPDGLWAGRDGSVICPETLDLDDPDDPGSPHKPSSVFMAWTSEVFSGTFQAAHRDADTAWQRFLGGKSRRPKFKRKGKSTESFQAHGDGLCMANTIKVLVNEGYRAGVAGSPRAKARKRGDKHSGAAVRQETCRHILLPKIGAVAVMSDDSLHPAMARSRKRATPAAGRHMGNRRRARSLVRHLRKTAPKASDLAALLRDIRQDAGLTVGQAVTALNDAADTRARHAVAAKAAELEAAAQELLDAAADDGELRKKALVRLRYAQKKAESAPKVKAARTDRWDEGKLTRLEAAGVITGGLEQAQVICQAYGLSGDAAARLMPLAAQARIIRATITLGADGLWWCSVGAEIPWETRVTPDPATGATRAVPGRRQRAGGPVGIDFGVREIMTVSDGTTVANPRHLEAALGELRTAHRRLSRSQPGSRRREKDRQLTGLIHADIARLRSDALHRATTMLVRTHDVIAVEGWNVQQVMKDGSRNLPRRVRRDRNRALADTGIGIGREQLKYKGPRTGTVIMVTAPDAETGRTCCLHKTARTTPLAPGEELFTSDKCDCSRPRRQNTARALAGWAAQELKHGPSPGGPVKPRRGDVRPAAAAGGNGQSPVKRAAGARRGRGETGTPDG